MPIQARAEEGGSIRTRSEIVTHGVVRSSHPFTGWTSLVTLSKDGPAIDSTQSLLICVICSPLREVLNYITVRYAYPVVTFRTELDGRGRP